MDRDKELAKLLASQFIARPDVKARQSRFGTYAPVRSKFTMDDLLAHIQGRQSFGHYMVNTDDTVKLFAFDVDLEKLLPEDHPMYRGNLYLPTIKNGPDDYSGWEVACPRTTWMSRKPGPAREFLKSTMHRIAASLVTAIEEILQIKALAAYSGSKGIHVYGMTGKDTPAALAREAAQLVLKEMRWEPIRGQNVYAQQLVGDEIFDAVDRNLHQFTLEVFPKQDSLDGKDLGNLMRLPLGVNYKSPKDGAFFLDLRTPYDDFTPMDPLEALTTNNIWAYNG